MKRQFKLLVLVFCFALTLINSYAVAATDADPSTTTSPTTSTEAKDPSATTETPAATTSSLPDYLIQVPVSVDWSEVPADLIPETLQLLIRIDKIRLNDNSVVLDAAGNWAATMPVPSGSRDISVVSDTFTPKHPNFELQITGDLKGLVIKYVPKPDASSNAPSETNAPSESQPANQGGESQPGTPAATTADNATVNHEAPTNPTAAVEATAAHLDLNPAAKDESPQTAATTFKDMRNQKPGEVKDPAQTTTEKAQNKDAQKRSAEIDRQKRLSLILGGCCLLLIVTAVVVRFKLR